MKERNRERKKEREMKWNSGRRFSHSNVAKWLQFSWKKEKNEVENQIS